MHTAVGTYQWELDYGSIATIWRGGCIIRSTFLDQIRDAYRRDPGLANLVLDPFFRDAIRENTEAWRNVAAASIRCGVPAPAICSALAYFDGYTSERLPANLLQAQRDYFGAHTYERIDAPRGKRFHTNWTGRGGETSSTAYNA